MTPEEAGRILPGHTVFHRGDRVRVIEVTSSEGTVSLRLQGRGMAAAADCDTTDDKVASLMVTFGIFPLTRQQADAMLASGLVVSRGRVGRQEDLRPVWDATNPQLRKLVNEVLGKNL